MLRGPAESVFCDTVPMRRTWNARLVSPTRLTMNLLRNTAILIFATLSCVACYGTSVKTLGLHPWGYGVPAGRLVIGRSLTAGGGECERWIDGMRTCVFHAIVGVDTTDIMSIVRFDKVYMIVVRPRAQDLHSFYQRAIATFGDPVVSSGPQGPTGLSWQDDKTCVTLTPAEPLYAKGVAQLVMWDGRERRGCQF